jgi:renalase
MKPVIVVGGGMAGIAAARELTAAGLPVTVLDRGRRLGGRMASRTIDGRVVDIGASYFTVSDPVFAAVVEDWRQRGLAREWTATFSAIEGAERTEKSGPMRWGAPRGLRSLVEDLAADLDVQQRTVSSVAPGLVVNTREAAVVGAAAGEAAGGEAAAVVLAMPDPQARRLLHPEFVAEAEALDDPFEPVLALTARWERRTWGDLDGAFVAQDPLVAWIADDGRRRGDDAPVLVAHSTPEFAAEHLVAPDEAAPLLTLAVRDLLGIADESAATQVHRWTFAKPTRRRDETFFLGDALVGLCGDAWSDRPRVESAYLSGRALGAALAERLGG